MSSSITLSESSAEAAAATRKVPRYLHVDALRGILLVMMAVNHIPSDIQIATNHIFGFVSAAEGFVFLSGLMSGWMYTRKYYKVGAAEMKDSTVRRALAIYFYHAVTFLAVLFGVRISLAALGWAPAIAPQVMLDNPIAAALSGLLLVQQPSLFDILPMYCAFMLVVPFIVIACVQGARNAVLAGSFLLWFLANLFSPQTPLIHGVVNTGSFNLLSWQLLFVFGAVCGHGWATGTEFWPKPRASLIAPAFVLATLLYLVRHAYVHVSLPGPWLDWLTNKNNLAPLRLLDTGLLYYLVYVVAARFPQLLSWRPLAFLGQHSIFVFAAHILVAYAIQAFPDLLETTSTGRWTATAIMVGSLFVAADIHRRWQLRAKRTDSAVNARQSAYALVKTGR